MSLSPEIERRHIIQAVADYEQGVVHPFGASTKYDLIYNGKRYPPKAIAGIAARLTTGGEFTPESISSGWAAGQACRVLDDLGFDVVAKPDVAPTRGDWTPTEVELVVADYFDMLREELMLRPYNKAEHRRRVIERMGGRSDAAVEFKRRNISAVLVGMGLPYIDGYKPASNYQGVLVDGIDDYLSGHRTYFDELGDAPAVNASTELDDHGRSWSDVLVEPPEMPEGEPTLRRPWITGIAARVDFRRRDAQNRRLGERGERFVVDTERKRLTDAGRDDLAARVEWSSRECGDGLGYDVRSYDESDETERLIEVKTTGLGRFFPFYVTRNELRCSQDVPECFRLYRVFDFARRPSLYVLHGSLAESCELEAIQWSGTPRRDQGRSGAA